ncbi:MAG: hypothetical protein NTX63_05505 [Candidatus Peregrinibacteria bacterium]|nr:hypothetical protein [Candidatus Peregrinibacteria bacterium]
MTQPSRLHSVPASISTPENSRDAAMRALGALGAYITPEMRATVLARIEADCGATAGQIASVTSTDVIEKPSRVVTDWREVDEIMGGASRNFFGPGFLKSERGIVIPSARIPKIRMTEAEVVSAIRLGHTISLHSNKLGNEMPSTMLDIREDELQRHGRTILTETPRGHLETFMHSADKLEWRQTSIGVVPGTNGLNYLQQMDVLVSYLKSEVVKGRPLSVPELLAVSEFERRRAELELLLIDWDKDHKAIKSRDGKPMLNWQVAADIMANLTITKLVRPTTVGLLNDIANAQSAKIPMLTRDFTATADRYSFGSFVALGPVGDRGACLDCWNPVAAKSNYGAIFSYNRSARSTDELSS